MKKSNANRKSNKRAPAGTSVLSGNMQYGRGSVIPASHRCKLMWAFPGTTAAGTGYTETVFSGNNITDPGLASSSSQPLGFDEMALWYTNYVFHGSEARLVANYASSSVTPTATALGGDVLLYANTSASASAVLADALAQPGVKATRLSEAKVATLKSLGTNKSVIGFHSSPMDTSVGTTASGPAAFTWCWHYGRASDAAYTGISIEYTIQIVYDITFFNRKLLALSSFEDSLHSFYLGESKWTANTKPVKAIRHDHKTEQLSIEDVNLDFLRLPPPEKAETKGSLTTSVASAKPTKFIDSDLSLHYTMVRNKNLSAQTLSGKVS